jgi:hypothetical protein
MAPGRLAPMLAQGNVVSNPAICALVTDDHPISIPAFSTDRSLVRQHISTQEIAAACIGLKLKLTSDSPVLPRQTVTAHFRKR